MRQKIIIKLFALVLLFSALSACKKADRFYDKLRDLPQIDNTSNFAYKAAYIVGDTMIIAGRLQPQNNLQVMIGGKIVLPVKTNSIKSGHGDALLDRVYISITAGMVGKAQAVKIISGGYTALGANIDVYSTVGPGSFSKSLKAVAIADLTSAKNIFLFCSNGKGDVYYFSPEHTDLRHVNSAGNEEVILSLLNPKDQNGILTVRNFLAGAVDHQGKYMYLSVITSTGYRLCQFDLQTKVLTTLNQSVNMVVPFDGAVGSAKMIVNGIYPDLKGNLYLLLGTGNSITSTAGPFLPDAIAKYNVADGNVTYIYKSLTLTTFLGMPGTKMPTASPLVALRFSPEENLMYALEESIYDFSTVVEVFDLDAGIKIQDFATSNIGSTNPYNVISPFSELKINMNVRNQANQTFGFMPMPGKRIQNLLFQSGVPAALGFPKWIVFDFSDKRTYAYAAGKFDLGDNTLKDADMLLNYDEAGNLYMTANGKMNLIKTQENN